MPRSVGCLGVVIRCFAVGFAGFGLLLAVVSLLIGWMAGGGVGLLIGLGFGLFFAVMMGVGALSLWARTRIMERWAGGTVGVYPAAPRRGTYYDNDLEW
jgi:hypothetical protein